MRDVQPTRPANLDPLASNMLERLQATPEAAHIVIGGGVALNCYAPPRLTRDVDAWWSRHTDAADRSSTVARIREIANDVARPTQLTVSERAPSTSEVVSIELQANRKTVFSFQIAPRDVELESPIVSGSPFAPIALETLADNLGAKMTALVARGAPRDFQDVYNVVRTGIARPDELWGLYERKNPGHDVAIAKAQVAQRLGDIEMRRPLDSIEPSLRGEAGELRAWVRQGLVGKPFDPPAQSVEIDAPSVREEPGLDQGLEL